VLNHTHVFFRGKNYSLTLSSTKKFSPPPQSCVLLYKRPLGAPKQSRQKRAPKVTLRGNPIFFNPRGEKLLSPEVVNKSLLGGPQILDFRRPPQLYFLGAHKTPPGDTKTPITAGPQTPFFKYSPLNGAPKYYFYPHSGESQKCPLLIIKNYIPGPFHFQERKRKWVLIWINIRKPVKYN